MGVGSVWKRLWPFGMMLALMTVGTAHADEWKVRCTELVAAGVDQAANCGREFSHRANPPGDLAASTLRVSYAVKGPPEEVVWFYLQASRIDLPSDSTAVLHVTGLRVERMRLPSQERGFAQGPASGTCQVAGLDTAAPSVRCDVRGNDPAVGAVRFAVVIDPPARGVATIFARELREARFTLAAAEQNGRLARMTSAAQPLGGGAAAETALPDEKTCAGEAQALRAEAAARQTGGADLERLAGVCLMRAAHGDPAKAEAFLTRSTEWFERAIARGDARSMAAYGQMIELMRTKGRMDAMGRHVQPSPDEAAKWQAKALELYGQAAAKGDAEGQFRMCQNMSGTVPGVSTPRDAVQALRWCQLAADQGHAIAAGTVATLYWKGIGTAPDPARAKQYFELAVQLGDSNSVVNLARAYEAGSQDTPIGPVQRDTPKALELYRKANVRHKVAELETAQRNVGAGSESTVFGLGVGYPQPVLPSCPGEMTPNGPPLCVGAGSSLARWFDQMGLDSRQFGQNGLRIQAIKVNDTNNDTSFLVRLLGISIPLDVAVDRNRVVHLVAAYTQIGAHQQILQLLTQKYGRPTRTGTVDWTDRRTGQLMRKTPTYHWDVRGLRVDYYVQDVSLIDNRSETPTGRIDVMTTQFATITAGFAAQRQATQSGKGRF